MEPIVTPSFYQPHLATPHHSSSDWSYMWPNWPNYDLVNYFIAPASLASKGCAGQNYKGHTILQTYPCLPEIRLVSNVYFEFSASEIHQHYFRAQAYPTASYYYPANCYLLKLYPETVVLRRIVLQLMYPIASHVFSPPLSFNTWYKWRFSLWDFPSHANPQKLAYKFELWETDHWTTYFDGMYVPNSWSVSPTNYYGFWLMNRGSSVPEGVKVDDTEIWIPAP